MTDQHTVRKQQVVHAGGKHSRDRLHVGGCLLARQRLATNNLVWARSGGSGAAPAHSARAAGAPFALISPAAAAAASHTPPSRRRVELALIAVTTQSYSAAAAFDLWRGTQAARRPGAVVPQQIHAAMGRAAAARACS